MSFGLPFGPKYSISKKFLLPLVTRHSAIDTPVDFCPVNRAFCGRLMPNLHFDCLYGEGAITLKEFAAKQGVAMAARSLCTVCERTLVS